MGVVGKKQRGLCARAVRHRARRSWNSSPATAPVRSHGCGQTLAARVALILVPGRVSFCPFLSSPSLVELWCKLTRNFHQMFIIFFSARLITGRFVVQVCPGKGQTAHVFSTDAMAPHGPCHYHYAGQRKPKKMFGRKASGHFDIVQARKGTRGRQIFHVPLCRLQTG